MTHRLKPLGRTTILDFETISSRTGPRVVEIAALCIESGNQNRLLHSLVDPECPCDSGASGIHGISNRELRDQPVFSELWSELWPMLEGLTVVAHNANFERQVLRTELWRLRQPQVTVRWFCTLRLARKLWPRQLQSYSLKSLAARFNLGDGSRHRAQRDVEATLQLLYKQLARAQEMEIAIPEQLLKLASPGRERGN